MRALFAIVLILLGQAGPAARVQAQSDPAAEALRTIDEETLRAHENYLASDELEGRAAGIGTAQRRSCSSSKVLPSSP